MGTLMTKDTGGGDFQILDAGTHVAVCTMVVGLGKQDGPYGVKDKVKLRFECPQERVEWTKDGEKHEGPAVIWATYTNSLTEKANLRHDLESWRGRAFTAEELAGFDLGKLVGIGCMLSVIHRESNGRTYANIAGIAKLPKGMEIPTPEGLTLVFNPDDHTDEEWDALPKWLQEIVNNRVIVDSSPQRIEERVDDFADDIPF